MKMFGIKKIFPFHVDFVQTERANKYVCYYFIVTKIGYVFVTDLISHSKKPNSENCSLYFVSESKADLDEKLKNPYVSQCLEFFKRFSCTYLKRRKKPRP